ncbi:DUF3618 domain-containing protein [Asanoa sp. WMMD1127]|uniref:DUF3618 domain-containing protein n=1 Tax=Asanoa sp. WMMD1127 TaxID=3016107 RepID=UPI002417F581|nr:DUF3618 domain-containing protein [Asanoa sp. WMMD1127]MDG4824357.1 DUF3618 domain-containing protein [Asanoa sp. WMMD1127]
MTAGNGNGHSNGSTSSDPAVLRAEIRRTRAELGETVQLLAAKADVKSRMKVSASHAADRFKAKASTAAARVRDTNGGRPAGQAALRANPVPVATLIGVAASAVAVILMVMRRRRR